MSENQWLIDLIKGLGIGGGPVFAFLYWQERRDRIAAQADYRALLPQVLNVASQATTSVNEVTKAVEVLGAAQKEAFMSPAQFGQLIRSLGSQLKKAG